MTEIVLRHKASPPNVAIIILLCVAAIGFRLGIFVALPAGLNVDTDGYRRIAICLRNSGTFAEPVPDDTMGHRDPKSTRCRPTAFRPPLYPLLLAVFVSGGQVSPVAIGGLHLGLGLATVTIVFWLARRWGLGRWSWLAALFTACDPILLYQSVQIMTETLAAFLATASLACLTWVAEHSAESAIDPNPKRLVVLRASLAGGMLGAACVSRPTFLPWSGLLVASFLLPHLLRTVGWKQIVALTCGLLFVLLPWGLRNYWQFGHFSVSTSHGGYTLMLGNNPSFYRFLREGAWGDVWHADELDKAWALRHSIHSAQDDLLDLNKKQTQEPGATVASTEFEDDQLAYAFARRFIREDPRMFLVACLVRVGRLWGLLPHRLSEKESAMRYWSRVATSGWYVMIFGLALLGAIGLGRRLWRAPWLWGLLLCLTFTAVHMLYWSDMRMRAPLMPFVCLLAAAGAEEIIRRVRRLK